MIALVGCPADGNVLVALDDLGSVTDEGTAFDAWLTSAPLGIGRTSQTGRLRTLVQTVVLAGTVTVTLTGAAGDTGSTQSGVRTGMAAGETDLVVVVPLAVRGRRFQMTVRLSSLAGQVALGGAELRLAPHGTGLST